MHARFLLGPAGSGKTHRCLAEIRAELIARPEGPPLILLAPKQATFQLERQLLAGGLAGYTRLQILSFERLAEFVLDALQVPQRGRLSEEGRLMVLRALLAKHADQLQLFRASARLPGFARQLNLVLRELQHHQLQPGRLAELAAKATAHPHLQLKLRDLATLLDAYLEWLSANRLQDTDVLLDFAAETLRHSDSSPALFSSEKRAADSRLIPPHPGPLPRGEGESDSATKPFHADHAPANAFPPVPSPWGEGQGEGKADAASPITPFKSIGPAQVFHLGGLWLDGFAEMTPQEMHLLAAMLPRSERALLAFCLPSQTREEEPWLSTWSVVSQTFRECHARIATLPGVEVSVEVLSRDPPGGRFAEEPALAHLEAHWNDRTPWNSPKQSGAPVSNTAASRVGLESLSDDDLFSWAGKRSQQQEVQEQQQTRPLPIRLVTCLDAEVEATVAAHEILRYVRCGGRFRDCAVLLRSLEGYHDLLRRVFSRRDIPFFLDRRESVSHHPLAELTRFSLRLAAYGWLREDWFGALKSGLVSRREADVDRLENAALEFGWEGEVWRRPLHVNGETELSEWAEALRLELVPPFIGLADRVRGEINGRELALALGELWTGLRVETTLESWAGELSAAATLNSAAAVHHTVWEQMQVWLENLELAFPTHAMRVNDWLPILEAGLANLSVGVVPPALDQVLIGTVDRSRNPELQLVILPGFNETVFPAPSPPAGLLTEPERDALDGLGARLGPGGRRSIGHERYYGYIACTRARQRLVITCAQRDDEARELYPSVFVGNLKQLFPTLKEEQVEAVPARWLEAEHANELIAPLLRHTQGVSAAPPAGDAPPAAGGVAERSTPDRSADLQSAVSRICNPHADPVFAGPDTEPRPAECNSGIQQIENLRYASLLSLPGLERMHELIARLPNYPQGERLSPALAEALYLERSGNPRVFRSSVSRLETFAACPFRFLIETGLRAEERKRFEVDSRERGSLQHQVLERFHQEIARSGRRWREVSPDEAAELIARLVDETAATYRHGLFHDDERNQFTAATLKDSLQRFIRVVIGWMRSYQLDPTFVELGFGMGDATKLPAWRIRLDGGRELALRGKVDRVDLGPWREEAPWCVVLDYKSGAKRLDAVHLHNGLQLQLPSYLAAIESFARAGLIEGCRGVRPAGMFYANLRGAIVAGDSRDAVLARSETERDEAYRHFGRFNADALRILDANATSEPSGQFNFQLKKNGGLSKRQADPLAAGDFTHLLEEVRVRLQDFGQRILAGEAAVDPYRHGKTKACDHCDLSAVCRIEARAHRFRSLEAPPRAKGEAFPFAFGRL